MVLQQIRIADGIRLSYIQTNTFKTGLFTLTLIHQRTRHAALCNGLLPALLRRGTERYPDMASLNRRLDDLYASCIEIRNGRIGGNLTLSLSAEVLDDQFIPDRVDVLGGTMEVMEQMLMHPKKTKEGFEPDAFAQEIRFAKDDLRATVNNTRTYAATRLKEMMHRADADYATMEETLADLDVLSNRALSDFHENLLRTSMLEFFYIGSLSADRLIEKLRAVFALSPRKEPYIPILPVAEPSVGFAERIEPMPVSQGKLSMGFRTGVCTTHPNKSAMLLLNELFGGSAASKLFLHVREKLNLCYYCTSTYFHSNGTLTVNAGIESANRLLTQQAILAQLDEIKQGHISDAEWHAARISLEHSYRQLYDSPFGLQSFYSTRLLLGMEETLEDAIAAVQRVTREQVIALANEILFDTVFFVEGTNQEEGDEDEA